MAGRGPAGISVEYLDETTAFYRDRPGITVTGQGKQLAIGFLSAHPKRERHKFALMRGPNGLRTLNMQQISRRVATLDDVRRFSPRLKRAGD